MIEESRLNEQPLETGLGPDPALEHSTARPRALHVVVPHEAWRRARSAALDSGLAFKDYMALLMLSARPIHSTDNDQAATADVNGDRNASAGPSHIAGPVPER